MRLSLRHSRCMTLRLEVRHAMNPHATPQDWTPSPQELPEGTVLHDTYRILHPIAEGGCGAVYAAAHARLPGQVAVKVLHRGLIRNLEAMTRFRQEAEITSTLRHPHIVQVLDFNVTPEGFPYLVMELLEGRPLAARLAEGVPLESATAARIVGQIAQAAGLLGRHVLRRAGHVQVVGQPRAPAGLRDAEVEDLHEVLYAVRRQQHDVVRLEVAVHDAAGVRRRQGLGDLGDDPRGRG